MQTMLQLLGIFFGAFLVWRLYRIAKANPDTFSAENFSKGFTTMGLLALALIAFVALLVLMVKSS